MPPKKVVKNEPNIIIESDSEDELKLKLKLQPIKKTTKKKTNIQDEPVIVNQINQINQIVTSYTVELDLLKSKQFLIF